MRITFLLILNVVSMLYFDFDRNKDNEGIRYSNMNTNTIDTKMKITIGSAVFTASLNSNATAKAFKEKLPLTINMKELNGNEKYFNLSNNLPANPTNPGTIHNGDLMLYGSGTLVLFYKSFETSYSYTSIGRIDNTAGLAAALGAGNVTVTFEVN